MLGPIGFFSYAASDDEISRGRLSQLRQRLAAELQQHIGRSQKVQIFQDVASIPFGASWELEIRESLAAASFLIPILTPAFFQSEWCCREVLQFRERELALGRQDLIFPIHYVDTDHLDPNRGEDCWSAEVYALLRTRQIAHFGALRFKDFESEAVLTALDRVAVSIRNALRAGKPVLKAQAEAAPEGVSANRASEKMTHLGRTKGLHSSSHEKDFVAAAISGEVHSLELIKRSPNAFTAPIKDQSLFRDARFILAVSARRPLPEIQERLPDYLKIGPSTRMNEIVLGQLAGVPLVHLDVSPPKIFALDEWVYFYLDRTSPLWLEFSRAGAIAIYLSDDWPDLRFHLWAVRE